MGHLYRQSRAGQNLVYRIHKIVTKGLCKENTAEMHFFKEFDYSESHKTSKFNWNVISSH